MGWWLLLNKVVAGLPSEVAQLKPKPETHRSGVIDDRFLPELTDFAFLEPNNFGARDAKLRVRKLACRYNCSHRMSTSRHGGT
jgi:hypothetical protein